jgi:hypothetical protein
MSESEQRIAKIERSYIGFEDHGLLSVSLTFNYGGSQQGIGHRAFGSSSEGEPENWRLAHEMGMDFIRRLLLACGVNQWERIVGRTVLVTCDFTSIGRIDPLPTEKGTSFDIEAWADSFSGVTA